MLLKLGMSTAREKIGCGEKTDPEEIRCHFHVSEWILIVILDISNA